MIRTKIDVPNVEQFIQYLDELKRFIWSARKEILIMEDFNAKSYEFQDRREFAVKTFYSNNKEQEHN